MVRREGDAVGMRKVSMHRLQELVRLHRLGEGPRSVARQLKMSPNTEREYRTALEAAGLLVGDVEALPELEVLKLAIEAHKPAKPPPQHASSVEQWREHVEALVAGGAAPKAISDGLRLEEWAPLFKDPLLANAAMDRLLHHAHVIEVTGASYRNPPRSSRKRAS